MRHGEFVAHGTHDELLDRSHYYAELMRISFTVEKTQG